MFDGFVDTFDEIGFDRFAEWFIMGKCGLLALW